MGFKLISKQRAEWFCDICGAKIEYQTGGVIRADGFWSDKQFDFCRKHKKLLTQFIKEHKIR